MNIDRFKFRVWYSHDKEMLYNAEKTYDYGCDGDNEIKDFRFYDLIECHKNGECILMQCTGLKDKNGKLIYEGDVLREVEPRELSYTGKCCGIKQVDRFCVQVVKADFGDRGTFSIGHNLCGKANELEIIGNIYENQEYLK